MALFSSRATLEGAAESWAETEDSSPQKSNFPKNFCLILFFKKNHIKATENCTGKEMALEQSKLNRPLNLDEAKKTVK